MAANENNPWGLPPNQPNFSPTGEPRSGKNNMARVLAVVAAVVVLGIAAAIGWFLANGGIPGGNSTTVTEDQTEETVTVTQPAAPDSGEDTPLEESTGPETSTTAEVRAAERDANRLSEVPAPAPQAEAIPAAAQADGVNERGWSANSALNCAPGEQLIYAARGADAWVTVCESGSGAMTYRSDVFGGMLTAPVMPGASNPASGRFMVDASPAVINVQGAWLNVEQDGQVVSSVALPVAWVFN